MYLTIQDLQKGMYSEILAVLTRAQDNVDQAITDAIAEVDAYLNARYDTTAEWAKTGGGRNTLTVKIVREVALYNCYNISNPVNMPESRVKRYEDVIKMLRDIQAGRANIPNLTLLTDAGKGGSTYLRYGSNPKRNNHY
jgi:phage gp36-like protein